MTASHAAKPPHGLFLWIPRTAGTSIWQRLVCPRSGHHAQRIAHLDRQFFPAKTITTFQHVYVPTLVEDGTITQDWLDEQFTFAFVRNPWDRLVSVYHHLAQGRPDQRMAALHLSFKHFIELVCAGDLPPVGRYSMEGLSYANRQTDWLYDRDGNRLFDFVGRMENLATDWQVVADTLGIHGGLDKTNQSRHKAYKDYYTATLRQLVAVRYQREIDEYGYTYHE